MVYLENNNHQDARELCIKYGKNDPDLWRKAISAWSIRADDPTIVNELKLALVHASEVLSVLTLIALLRECEGPLRIVTTLSNQICFKGHIYGTLCQNNSDKVLMLTFH